MSRAGDPGKLVERLGRGTPLERLSLTVDSSGYVDLRNLQIPSVREPDLAGLALDHVDFTGSNFENTRWVNCDFTHVKFDRVKGSGMNFANSRIRHSSFVRADLHRANWGWKDPPEPLIEDCLFERTDLRQTTHTHPRFRRCHFADCKFNGTVFTSRFEDCAFDGVVADVGFSAWERERGRTVRWNEMRNVDFSRAELRHVAFCGGIDLTHCRFAETGYLRVPHPRAAYIRALDAARTWPEAWAKPVVEYLQNWIKQCYVEEQPFDLVRPEEFVEYFGEEAGHALVEELKRAIES